MKQRLIVVISLILNSIVINGQNVYLDDKVEILLNRGNYTKLQIENTTVIFDESQWDNHTLEIDIDKINHKNFGNPTFKLLSGKGLYKNYNIRFESPHIPVMDFMSIYQNDKMNNEVYGKIIYLGNSGIIYTYNIIGGSRKYYLRKFTLKENSISEVKQPFYYIGEGSKLNDNIIIYENPDLVNKVGMISKNTNVFVIGLKVIGRRGEHDYVFLVKGETGIIGWHKPFPILKKDPSDYLPFYSLDFLTRFYKL